MECLPWYEQSAHGMPLTTMPLTCELATQPDDEGPVCGGVKRMLIARLPRLLLIEVVRQEDQVIEDEQKVQLPRSLCIAHGLRPAPACSVSRAVPRCTGRYPLCVITEHPGLASEAP